MLMKPSAVIRKKRDGKKLTRREIKWFIDSHTAGKIENYHASALAMAIFFNGMSPPETAAMTESFMKSGDIINPSEFVKYAADKHSTGGVGDTVSLILAPLAASLGLCVPMVSGRGLGHTGGTLDKLEAIPGFRTDLSLDRFKVLANRIGCCMIGQTERMCPADKRWYALRDVTATVESIPLIVASIMSKKMAEGISGLILDVKVGSGAFMKTMEDAQTLAKALVATGKSMGRTVRAMITDMNQPLARCAGNALETTEALYILRNEQKGSLYELSVALTAQMLLMAGKYKTLKAAENACRRNIENGKALVKFAKMIEAQHGDPRVCDNPKILPKAKISKPFKATRGGYISAIDTMALGLAANALGAGRAGVKDKIDPAVGLTFDVSLGDKIKRGDRLLTIWANDSKKEKEARGFLNSCFTISKESLKPPSLIKKVVE